MTDVINSLIKENLWENHLVDLKFKHLNRRNESETTLKNLLKLPVNIERIDNEILVSFSDPVDVDQREDEAFLRTVGASRNSRKVFLDVYVWHILPMEACDVLSRLFVGLLDDFTQYIGNNLNYILRWNYSCAV